MNKNVCIIHYNTPTLTEKLVESINKHTPGTTIYIFDNSDKKPFKKEYENVTVIDNTKGQIINFKEWLKKYPKRTQSGGKTNNWGSAKHAYSVEKCMEIVNEPFVLLDSDVLIKKDFSNLYVEKYCYIGEVVNQPKSKIKRVLPFICYVNPTLCFQKKIHYFDERYMHGLRVGVMGDCYDTGAALYLLTEKAHGSHDTIKVADYVVHYGSGSWVKASTKMKKKAHIAETEWLTKHKNLWYEEQTSNKNIKQLFATSFDHIYCLHYLPYRDRLPVLREEFERVGIDESASYFSWKYVFPSDTLDCMYDDKGLNIDAALRSVTRKYIKKVSLYHYEIIKEAYALGYKKILILEDDVRFHSNLDYIKQLIDNMPDSDVILFDKMTCSRPKENIKYKELIKKYPKDTLYGNVGDIFFIFASCYALNRNGMQHIIERQEEKLLPPDTPFNDSGITASFAVVNLAIQDPKLKTRKIESYSKIGLDTSTYGPTNTNELELLNKETGSPSASSTDKTTISKKIIKTSPLAKPLKKPKTKNQINKPVVTKKIKVLDKAKHTRRLYTATENHNKLYDVFI